jgi:hypothetical protein
MMIARMSSDTFASFPKHHHVLRGAAYRSVNGEQ